VIFALKPVIASKRKGRFLTQAAKLALHMGRLEVPFCHKKTWEKDSDYNLFLIEPWMAPVVGICDHCRRWLKQCGSFLQLVHTVVVSSAGGSDSVREQADQDIVGA
jgi:hypothetical protein